MKKSEKKRVHPPIGKIQGWIFTLILHDTIWTQNNEKVLKKIENRSISGDFST